MSAPPAPPMMKMAGAIRESPLREVCRGHFHSKGRGGDPRKATRFAFALSTCRVWANLGLHIQGEIMDTARVFFMGAAYVFWVLAAIMLVSSVFSGSNIFFTAVGLFIVGLIFFVLNKVTARK